MVITLDFIKLNSVYLEQIEKQYKLPNDTALEKIYTTNVTDESKCYGLNQWTTWNNARNPSKENGNDYETLHDHKIKFK